MQVYAILIYSLVNNMPLVKISNNKTQRLFSYSSGSVKGRRIILLRRCSQICSYINTILLDRYSYKIPLVHICIPSYFIGVHIYIPSKFTGVLEERHQISQEIVSKAAQMMRFHMYTVVWKCSLRVFQRTLCLQNSNASHMSYSLIQIRRHLHLQISYNLYELCCFTSFNQAYFTECVSSRVTQLSVTIIELTVILIDYLLIGLVD